VSHCEEDGQVVKQRALASLRVLYLTGIIRMPLVVQRHLRLCGNSPAKCLLCQMTQLQIETQKGLIR
jgi:hypothetical protein